MGVRYVLGLGGLGQLLPWILLLFLGIYLLPMVMLTGNGVTIGRSMDTAAPTFYNADEESIFTNIVRR